MRSFFRAVSFAAVLACALSARADFIDLYADKLDMPLNKAPRLGHSKLVLIPVQIDNAGFPAVDTDRLNQFFGAPVDGGPMTFTRYFDLASGGRFQPEVTVAPLVRYAGCPPMIHGNECTLPRGDVSAIGQGMDFVRDVFRRAHDEGKVDFRAFDHNGIQGEADSVIDGAMIVVNVPGVGIAFPIEYLNNGSNLNGGTGGALVLDGVRIPYCAVGGASFPGGKQHLEYVILHEFAHTVGLADLYYEHPAAGDKYPEWQGLHFSLMGDYNYSDDIALPDPESRRALGWQHHRLVSGTKTITLSLAAQGGEAVKLGMMVGGRKEYFLAEARGGTNGLDTGVRDASGKPVYGLALYHVDWSRGPEARTGAWPSRLISCLDCDPFHPFIRNLESSGTFSLVSSGSSTANHATKGAVADDMVLFQGGAISSLDNVKPLSDATRYVSTNYYDGTPSGVSIRDIKVNDDHTVTATFTAPAVSDPCSDVSCPPQETCQAEGVWAGNCLPVEQVIPDGGPAFVPPVAQSGCQTTGGPGLAGALLVAGLALAALARRRRD